MNVCLCQVKSSQVYTETTDTLAEACLDLGLDLSVLPVLRNTPAWYQRGSVSCGSGWSVPCVSIQLTDPFGERARCVFHRQSFHFDTRGHRTGAHTDDFTDKANVKKHHNAAGEACCC
jgi:hypothetical protein